MGLPSLSSIIDENRFNAELQSKLAKTSEFYSQDEALDIINKITTKEDLIKFAPEGDGRPKVIAAVKEKFTSLVKSAGPAKPAEVNKENDNPTPPASGLKIPDNLKTGN